MKYSIDYTKNFKKQYDKLKRQGKDVQKLYAVIEKLANAEKLEFNYRNHRLRNNKKYNNCYECHIEPDWLLVYKYEIDELILLLFATGSHSELFKD